VWPAWRQWSNLRAMAPVGGVLAAQTIKPQARTLAEDRGLQCVVVDYDAMRGMDDPSDRLF
jgi:RecB family endonuclease NucS